MRGLHLSRATGKRIDTLLDRNIFEVKRV